MHLVDANVLLYSINRQSRWHEESRAWLDRSLSGGTTVGLPWLVLLAFVRLSTSPRVFPQPLTTAEATTVLADWVGAPASRLVTPTARHLVIFSELVDRAGTGGNLVNDAHLAALAIEHRATVVTYDTDFARFAGVRWRTPGRA